MGVSLTLLALVSALLGKDWALPRYPALIASSSFALAIIHLLVGTYYAALVSKLAAFFVRSVGQLDEWLGDATQNSAKLIAGSLANVEMNIPTLLVKSNCLAVAQELYLRGVAFLGVGAFLAITYRLMTYQ